MYYCHIVNQEIVAGPRPLPNTILPENAMVEGWYPVVYLNVPHLLDCNPLTQMTTLKMNITDTQVECWYEVENKSEDEVEQSRQLLMLVVRDERNKKLLHSDWTQLPNAPLSTEQKAVWETYRQLLRDFPGTVDLANIQWPTEPV